MEAIREASSPTGDRVPGCCYPTECPTPPARFTLPAPARSPTCPGEALLERAEDLARRWAVALILARPLARAGEVPLERIAREAPLLCAQVVRAVQADVELERLTGRGADVGRAGPAPSAGLAAICGARDPAALAESVESLRGVLWAAMLDELAEPSVRLLADLSDRLAHVCTALLTGALEAAAAPSDDDAALAREPVAGGSARAKR